MSICSFKLVASWEVWVLMEIYRAVYPKDYIFHVCDFFSNSDAVPQNTF